MQINCGGQLNWLKLKDVSPESSTELSRYHHHHHYWYRNCHYLIWLGRLFFLIFLALLYIFTKYLKDNGGYGVKSHNANPKIIK